MRILTAAALAALTTLAVPWIALAQEPDPSPVSNAALRVFLDCDRRCDFDFIRQEVTFINWVRDQRDGQVHVLVTRQGTGSGIEFQLDYIGLEEFEGQDQLLRYTSSQTDTDDERRRGFARTLRLGLARYIAQTEMAAFADLVVETPAGTEEFVATEDPAADPWNFWVFSIGLKGFARGEDRFDSQRLEASMRANRTTPAWKFQFQAVAEYGQSNFQFDDGSEFKDVTRDTQAGGQVVKTLSTHWGAGVGASMRQSTFFNLEPSYRGAVAAEYNIYPYDESSQRRLTLTYFLGLNRFNYREVTIFDSLGETLVDQGLIASLDLERPWGSASFDLQATHFVQEPSDFNISVRANLEYRILRGLSVDLSGGIESIRSQRYLPASGATPEEILLERRALETDFRFSIGLGLRYTFGSIFNNVVNARLSGSARGFHSMLSRGRGQH